MQDLRSVIGRKTDHLRPSERAQDTSVTRLFRNRAISIQEPKVMPKSTFTTVLLFGTVGTTIWCSDRA